MKATSQTMGRLAVLFVVAVALVSGVACGQSAEAKKQKALARGEQYLRDGKVNEAIIEFRSALQVDQDFVPAVHALGRAYMAKSWYGDAARELQRAQKLSPDALPIAADFGRHGRANVHLSGKGMSLLVARSEVNDIAAALGPTERLTSILHKVGLK